MGQVAAAPAQVTRFFDWRDQIVLGLTFANLTKFCYCGGELGERQPAGKVECGAHMICNQGVSHRQCGIEVDNYKRVCPSCDNEVYENDPCGNDHATSQTCKKNHGNDQDL
ncbi:hypothetical protein PCASD_07572 [Puccinia coronata f. sp. avenae]|uniref:Uncharacterized protein n=1 Tax=Puccinia coronata f. sp. avenae TaxID=200324 RepID=A0A2N5TGS1_9BASI|nr:hypothetical protein PCASD_07572 [Puccinia coronata f. sp. avenae]